MKKNIMILIITVFTVFADESAEVKVDKVNKAFLMKDNGAVPLLMGHKLSMDDMIRVDGKGMLKLEFKGSIYQVGQLDRVMKVSEILKGGKSESASFVPVKAATVTGVHGLESKTVEKSRK